MEKWRLEHPHDTPPYRFTPSPTFGHSSAIVASNSVNEALYIQYLYQILDNPVPETSIPYNFIIASPSTPCPTGQHLDTLLNACVADMTPPNPPTSCSIGFSLVDGICVLDIPALSMCPPTQILQGTSCVCPPGEVMQGLICAAPASTCPKGFTLQNGQCVASSCIPSYTCSGNSVLNSCTGDTTACASGQTCINGACLNSCNPTPICQGNNIVNPCTGAVISACVDPYICQGAACTIPAPQVVSWTVTPLLVKQNATTNVSWEVKYASSCTVTGTNGDSWMKLSGTKISGPIPAQTIYTLTCKPLAGSNASTVVKTATVNIIPTFQEK